MKVNSSTSASTFNPSRPTANRHIEVVGYLLTLTATLALFPLLLGRALIALASRRRLFDRSPVEGPRGRHFSLLAFAGQFPGRHLARLLNLLRHELVWLGPCVTEASNHSALRPGLFTPKELQTRIGIVSQESVQNRTELPDRLLPYLLLLARTLVVSLLTGKRLRPAPAQVSLFGVSVSNEDLEGCLSWIFNRVASDEQAMVPFVNAHCFNVAYRDEAYLDVLKKATKVLPDGSGVRLACRFQGLNLKANLNGTDLFPHLCAESAQQGIPLFLLGAAPGVAETVAGKMCDRYPGLRIAGTQHGFFSAEEESAVIDRINRSGARILLVAMGVPQQELWLARNLERLRTPVNLGVGGLFDFYSDRISRAPVWLRELGMEWIWRLLQEPRRMWQRYVVGNPLFLLRAWRDSRRRSAQHLIRRRGRGPQRRLGWWLRNRLGEMGKRALDLIAAAILLLLLSPLLALTALLIRLESPGPVLFSQSRVGLRGRPFTFWKFRSMYIDAEQRKAELQARNEMDGGVLFKMKHDPRITRVGRLIRRFSIDELPQLWNVLRGDMSLVGPRPALPSEVAQYTLEHRRRLLAQPGITCTWQVSGRSDIPFRQQVEMDLDYIHQATLKRDLQLLLKTIPAVFGGKGAY
ncbi:MAG: WecB/TagA/CpsF family glycosyltransferase [Chromatiales bacterium]